MKNVTIWFATKNKEQQKVVLCAFWARSGRYAPFLCSFFSCCAGCSVILYSRYFIYALRESKRPAREKIKELSNVFSRMGAMWFSAWKIPKTLYFVLLQCVLSLCVILYKAQHIWGYTYCITMFQSSAFAFYLCIALRFFSSIHCKWCKKLKIDKILSFIGGLFVLHTAS